MQIWHKLEILLSLIRIIRFSICAKFKSTMSEEHKQEDSIYPIAQAVIMFGPNADSIHKYTASASQSSETIPPSTRYKMWWTIRLSEKPLQHILSEGEKRSVGDSYLQDYVQFVKFLNSAVDMLSTAIRSNINTPRSTLKILVSEIRKLLYIALSL